MSRAGTEPTQPHVSSDTLAREIGGFWDERIVPALQEYITIPNESPHFDKDWAAHGHMERAVGLVTAWMEAQGVPGCTVRVHRAEGRTPLILAEIPGDLPGTVLIYGHIDKQPPMVGWREGLGPWTPVLDAQGRLYGRGSADDGYAGFAALAAVRSLKAQGLKHGRILIMVECSEESGSPDLPHYMEACKQEIGAPGLVICLDSGCGNYEQLWSTTSLRGIVGATLKVEVLREGVHSGLAGGIVPNPMQVARLLLERLENAQTGELRPAALKVEIPPERVEQARRAARTLGGALSGEIPFVQGVRPLTEDPLRQLLESTWAPALAVIGQEGMPLPEQAGNVLLPALTLRLSLRTPPTLAPGKAAETLRSILEADPPFGAKVSVSAAGQSGWNAPAVAPWLAEATDAASREFYGKEACYAGIGGTIPFMAMLGERFPAAQFLITGVLGPNANAHGPNEFLHVPYAKRLTCCLVRVLAAHHAHAAGK